MVQKSQDGSAENVFCDTSVVIGSKGDGFQQFSGDLKRCNAVLKNLRREDELVMDVEKRSIRTQEIVGFGKQKGLTFRRWYHCL